MNSKILLVEGTSGIGKSTLLTALLRTYIAKANNVRSILHLTQAHTYGPIAKLEDNNTLTKAINRDHLDTILSLLTWCVASVKGEQTDKFFCLVDTLHLTHCHRPGVLEWADVEDYDANLKGLDCKLVFIKAHEKTIWDRGLVPRINDDFITTYGKKFGNRPEEIHQYFIREQIQLEKLALKSSLDKLYLQAEQSVDENARLAYNFWLE